MFVEVHKIFEGAEDGEILYKSDELIRVKDIIHVYMVMPHGTRICIEYKTKKGDIRDIYEEHYEYLNAARRVSELLELLNNKS